MEAPQIDKARKNPGISNLDHIRSYYEALNSGAADLVASHFTDDAVHYYTRKSVDNGAFIAGEALQPTATATTVKIKEGEDPVVTDGPFAESKEQLGGFYLFECKDMDEAIEYAKGIPFQEGTVEVRPVMDFSDLGYEDFTPGPVKATA